MSWIVNGDKIDDKLFVEEVDRMRAQYQATFKDQSAEEQEKQLQEWARENVFERVLLQQAAGADPQPVPKDVLDKAYQELYKEHDGEEKFLQSTGLTKKDAPKIRLELELKYKVERLIERITKDVDEADSDTIRKYYQADIDKYTIPEQIRAAHIVVNVNAQTPSFKAKLAIIEIQKKLEEASSFEEVADKYSDCADNGGDLGYFSRGQMVQRFEDVVFAMKPNEVSDIFETEFGFHIAKVIDKQPAKPMPFSQAADEIKKQIAEEKRNKKVENYIDTLRKDAEITEFFTAQEGPLEKKFSDLIEYTPLKQAERHKPLNSVLIKPSGPDCNMDCSYCFYLEKEALFSETKVHRMSEEILEETIKQVMQGEEKYITFGWQGGEPTLMGLDFFRKAVQLQRRYGRGQTVGNGLQTNGILLDKDWAKFLSEYSFLVGLSLDGPQHIHDRYRLLKGGDKTWRKVNDRAKLLQDAGVAVNALTVVNDYSVQFPEEIYNYHKSIGLNFQQYIPCVETDPNDPAKAAPFSVAPRQYGEFLCALFDLWLADFDNGSPTVSIRNFDAVLHSYVGLNPPDCTLMRECGVYTVIEHNGDVYSCDFFVEPQWKLGNVMDDSIYNLLNSDKQDEFGKVKTHLAEKCAACEWLKYCWGGCPKDRLRDPRDNNLSHFCESYIAFFEHADKSLRQMANQWQRLQGAGGEKVGNKKINANEPCPCGSGKKYKKCCGMNNK